MKYVLFTIGQRDVQLHRELNGFDYGAFSKESLKQVQPVLKQLITKNKLVFKPIGTGREDRSQLLTGTDLEKSREICFPLIEQVMQWLPKDYPYKVFLIYTNRKHSGGDKAFILNEPWYFSELVEHFWHDLISWYVIDAELQTINLCEDMYTSWDIDTEFAYFQMNKIVRQMAENADNNFQKMIVFNAGGIPKVSQAMDAALHAYFPKQIDFMEQNHGNISKSRQHIIQKNYALKFSILQNVKQFDFSGAYKDAIELNVSSLNRNLFELMEVSYFWLYQDKFIAGRKLDHILSSHELDNDLEKTLTVMKEMLQDKNAVGCNLLRTIQEARKENWWGMTTIFISTAEQFIIEQFRSIAPESVVSRNKRLWFDLSKLPFDAIYNTDDRFKNRHDSNLFSAGWGMFGHLIRSGLSANGLDALHKGLFSKMNNFLQKIENLREARNSFVHEGRTTIPKQKIDQCLQINSKKKSRDRDFNSETFHFLIQQIEQMKHIAFVNWIPSMQKELMEQVSVLSPMS